MIPNNVLWEIQIPNHTGRSTIVRKIANTAAGVTTQAKGLAVAVGKAIQNPTPVSTEERERRLAICQACEFLVEGKRCLKCGCHVNWKTRLAAWHCPIDRW